MGDSDKDVGSLIHDSKHTMVEASSLLLSDTIASTSATEAPFPYSAEHFQLSQTTLVRPLSPRTL